MKQAHITSRPGIELGDKVLGLCGKEFKIKVMWDDIPDDKPICRSCVDIALKAMTEADSTIEIVRSRVRRLSVSTQVLSELLDDDLTLDVIADRDAAHDQEQAAKIEAKAEKKRVKRTCICTWEDADTMIVDSACPIHGRKNRDIEDVELPEEMTEEK